MQLNELRNLIRSYLFESLESQQNIDKLSHEILTVSAKLTLEYDIFPNPDGSEIIHQFHAIKINSEDINAENYSDAFQRFIKQRKIIVYFVPHILGNFESDSISTRGAYRPPGSIYLKLDTDLLKRVNDILNHRNQGAFNTLELDAGYLYTLLYYAYHSTLIHELQHAFDDWKSSGKYLNTKLGNQFQVTVYKYMGQNLEAISDKDLSGLNTSYLKSPHEVNARFTQAFAKIRMWKFADPDSFSSNDKRIKHPFEKVKESFISNFDNWHMLSSSTKRQLIKRVFIMWDKYDPNIKK